MGKRKNAPTKPVEEDSAEEVFEFDEDEEQELEEKRNRLARGRRGKREEEEEKEDGGNASDSDSDAGRVPSGVAVDPSTGRRRFMYTNKQRVLVVASRGITARYRHLLEDLKKLIPHHKKDSKLDTKGDIRVVNEIAEVKSCNQVVYIECRKHTDLYLYVSRTPHGPSAKFQAVNIHTMDELKLTGNCMLGSRPLLNFDAKFDTAPHLQMYKEMLTDVFNTPLGHPKSKPFVDRVMSFYVINNSIWVRNYQITESTEKVGGNKTKLVEIGPRFVLIPIRIFSGSFGGATLYQNPTYVTPNDQRSAIKKAKGTRFTDRVEDKKRRLEKEEDLVLPPDELAVSRLYKERELDFDDYEEQEAYQG